MGHLKRSRYCPKGHKEKTTPRVIATRDLAARRLELRREGLTNGEIAARLSVDRSSNLTELRVRDLILKELKDTATAAAEDVRSEELDRLDRVFNRMYRIMMGDGNRDRVAAANTAIKAMERRAALLGLDAPKQVDIKDDRQHVAPPAAIEDIVAQLAEEAEREGPVEGS